MNIEHYILGACFHSSSVMDVVQSVSVDDFHGNKEKLLFSAVETLVAKGLEPDTSSVYAEAKKLDASFIASVENECIVPGNMEYMLSCFREHADKTKYLLMAKRINKMADSHTDDIRREIESSLTTRQNSKSEHIAKPLKRAFDSMEHAYNNKGLVTGVPSGIEMIDNELSGFHKTDMILVAARPSIGKTALALQIADTACITKKVPTLFITLEMSNEQLASRVVLSRSKINVSKARNGLLNDSDWPRMTQSSGDMNDSPFFVDDCAGATIEQIAAKAKAEKLKNDIGLLIIDYLGLIGGGGTEYERVTNASRKTKILAKTLNIPIVALHQLNRDSVKDSKPRRPTMNDLRSSGQLEQDADVIILLHREKKEPIEKCELIIEKNRHGKTGIIEQQWNGPINRIEEIVDYGNEPNY